MDTEQERFLNELLNDFRIEASEHYQAIIDGLILLENSADASVQHSTIEKIFREVHSLKGASRAVNLLDIEKLCSGLENVFSSLKKGESTLILPLIDAFHKASDLLHILLNDVNQNQKNRGNYNLPQILKNLEFAQRSSIQSKNVVSGPNDTFQPSGNQIYLTEKIVTEPIPDLNNISPVQDVEKAGQSDSNQKNIVSHINEDHTVRISTNKLNNLLRQAEELITIKSTFEYYTKELENINYEFSSMGIKSKADSTNGMDSNRIETIYGADKNFRKKHERDLNQLSRQMIQFQRVSHRLVDDLLHDIKTTLLFPFSSMLSIIPKIVRDLSKEYSKEIEIVITGDTIEVDRRILEEIKDPMIHLIRNSIDHGIETSTQRIAKGKRSKGKIEISITQDVSQRVLLVIKDDGKGIDKHKIIVSAQKLGILKPEEIGKLADEEIYSMIFHSGISTSPFITDISGRGLGMAIVADKIQKLGGSIELDTVKDSGTTFTISLPQTLATFRGVLVRSADQYFIIPSSAVVRAIRIKYSEIKTVESKQTICYQNETVGLAVLQDILKMSSNCKKKSGDQLLHLLMLKVSQKKIAFVVDEILGEQEGIIKDLGSQLLHVNNVAGATILGNGSVVLILNPMELINSAAQINTSFDYILDKTSTIEETGQKSILIAEDSITIRTLLRNFIENAGFLVKTAVDGLEAYNFLQSENFDLVVSDIEMPRMNGFELTAKIRDEKRFADLPIILVTALETADDRQRGMEVGANAYIIKSSFEKSTLIETIQRLL